MKRTLQFATFCLLAVAFVALAMAAKPGETDTGTNGTKQATFGSCVSDAADVKNTCYDTVKETRTTCRAAAKNATGSTADKACKQDYKQDMKQCKADFKQAKKECTKLKHSFLDSMKASFK